jgi:phosphatidylglycerophosphate synthase
MLGKHTANAITLSRLGFVPLFVVAGLLDMGRGFVALLVIQSGLDWLDGWVARRWQLTSDYGRQLDSLVDVPVWLSGFGVFFYLIRHDIRTIFAEYWFCFILPCLTFLLMNRVAKHYTGRLSTMHLYTAKLTAGFVLLLMLITLFDEFSAPLAYVTAASAIIFHLEAMTIYAIEKQDADENLTSIIEVLRKHYRTFAWA